MIERSLVLQVSAGICNFNKADVLVTWIYNYSKKMSSQLKPIRNS